MIFMKYTAVFFNVKRFVHIKNSHFMPKHLGCIQDRDSVQEMLNNISL